MQFSAASRFFQSSTGCRSFANDENTKKLIVAPLLWGPIWNFDISPSGAGIIAIRHTSFSVAIRGHISKVFFWVQEIASDSERGYCLLYCSGPEADMWLH